MHTLPYFGFRLTLHNYSFASFKCFFNRVEDSESTRSIWCAISIEITPGTENLTSVTKRVHNLWGPCTVCANVYGWQKWTFHRKYNHFEKSTFSKIDLKIDSQSILEVGHFTSVKKWCFFKTVIFCIGNPIVNLMDFDDYQ